MRAHFVIYSVAALLAFANNASAARILGLFPHTGKSHQMVFEPLLRKLADRGHHLTVVSFFPQKNPPENYTDVSLEGIAVLGVETIDLNIWEESNILYNLLGINTIMKQLFDIHPLGDMALEVCTKLVSWPPLAAAMRKEYDVILVENFNSDCMLGLMHVYGKKVPTIGLLTSSLMPWSADRIGVSDNPSYVPVMSGSYTSRMSFLERLKNTFISYYFKIWYRYNVQMKEQELIEKHFGRKIPELSELAKNTTMMMANVYHSLNGARPLLPGLIEVGGMHLDHRRTVIPSVSKKSICL
jgi:glucuronosyltransferase